MTNQLTVKILTPDELSLDFKNEMFNLYCRYYDKTCRHIFLEDLSEKNYIIALQDSDNMRLQGFSTVAVSEYSWRGKKIRILFSGDTIVDQEYWGQQLLPYTWCQLAGQIKSEAPHLPLYWLLIVKGPKTYRFMTLFSKLHFPSYKWSTPNEFRQLMNFIGYEKFGVHFDKESGLIRFSESRGQLKPEFGVEQRYLHKSDVSFFLKKNPNYLLGEELLCLTELNADNMLSLARRGFQDGFRKATLRQLDDY